MGTPNALRAVTTITYPAVITFVFACKCGENYPIDRRKACTVFSVEEAERAVIEFAKTVEPRTISCQCGLEKEYFQVDVQGYPLESA